MPTIQCLLENKNYRLDYTKARLVSGGLYHGTLYLDKILDFYFEVFDNGDPTLFAPLHAADNLKQAITGAIRAYEATLPAQSTSNRKKDPIGGVD